MVITAGLISGIGMMLFNAMLAKATPKDVGAMFILMILMQTAVPAIYHGFINGRISFTQGCGFGFAIVAAYCITKG
jgi:hypothetical protein